MELQLRDFEPRLYPGLVVKDVDYVLDQAREALEHPADSAWRDDELWATHTLMFATPDYAITDDDLPGWSNYRSILRDMLKVYPDDVEDASFGHWTFSRFCAIKVRVVDADGYVTPAFVEALEVATDLRENNHLYDEGDYMELENEVADAHLKSFAVDNKLDLDTLRDVMNTNDVYYSVWERSFDSMDEDKLVELTRQAMSTWEAHYYSGDGHYPEQCYYCERAKEVA